MIHLLQRKQKSLKTSAMKEILPIQPIIKLGMTRKFLLNTFKKADYERTANGEQLRFTRNTRSVLILTYTN